MATVPEDAAGVPQASTKPVGPTPRVAVAGTTARRRRKVPIRQDKVEVLGCGIGWTKVHGEGGEDLMWDEKGTAI